MQQDTRRNVGRRLRNRLEGAASRARRDRLTSRPSG